MKRIFSVLFIICLIYTCDNTLSNSQHEYEEDDSSTIVIINQTKLLVNNTNGSITITGVDTTNNLYLDITRKVRSRESVNDAEAHISDISISTVTRPSEIEVTVDHPQGNDLEYEIDLNLILPFVFNHDLNLGNGSIALLSSSKMATIDLGNGSIAADIAVLDTCVVNISVGNGNIDLSIPSATNAILDASVGNGNVSSSGLTIQNQQISGTHLRGTLGTGLGAIALSVGNGNIVLRSK